MSDGGASRILGETARTPSRRKFASSHRHLASSALLLPTGMLTGRLTTVVGDHSARRGRARCRFCARWRDERPRSRRAAVAWAFARVVCRRMAPRRRPSATTSGRRPSSRGRRARGRCRSRRSGDASCTRATRTLRTPRPRGEDVRSPGPRRRTLRLRRRRRGRRPHRPRHHNRGPHPAEDRHGNLTHRRAQHSRGVHVQLLPGRVCGPDGGRDTRRVRHALRPDRRAAHRAHGLQPTQTTPRVLPALCRAPRARQSRCVHGQRRRGRTDARDKPRPRPSRR